MKELIKSFLKKIHLFRFAKIFINFIRFLIKILNTFFYLLFYYFKNKKIINIFLKTTNNYSLFITHNYGGGTAKFQSIFFGNNDYFYIIKNSDKYELFLFEYDNKKIFITKKLLIKLLMNSKKICVNSLYTFKQWAFFLSILIKLKTNNPLINIQYMIHDYHSICPNLSLIHDNHYCNLNCLNEKCKFSYFDDHVLDIKKWRNNWNNFLTSIDSIICFSQSSFNYIKSVYPNVIKKIQIIPHDMSYCKNIKINFINKPFNLGIVGNICSAAKGMYVFDYLANNFEKYNLKIHLLGTKKEDIIKDIPIRKNEVILGTYVNSELQNLIIKNKISFIAFVSICPETFSYVISELMLMNIPIIGFNIGAQAEKLKNYKNGIVVNSKEEMLDYLLKKSKEK